MRPRPLYFSERKLWDECVEARPVLERLARLRASHDRNEYAKRLKYAVELLERIEQEAHWVGVPELERDIENFTDMMREDGWVQDGEAAPR